MPNIEKKVRKVEKKWFPCKLFPPNARLIECRHKTHKRIKMNNNHFFNGLTAFLLDIDSKICYNIHIIKSRIIIYNFDGDFT